MTRKAHDKIMAGLKDALAFAKGDKRRGVAHQVSIPAIDVRAARAMLGMTQKDFAHNFGVSLDTVRNWEQGRRRPEGPARVLLAVIESNPKAVLAAVKAITAAS
jgi:putative transcriptional regulator